MGLVRVHLTAERVTRAQVIRGTIDGQRERRADATDHIPPPPPIVEQHVVVVLLGDGDRRSQRERAAFRRRPQKSQQLRRIRRDGWRRLPDRRRHGGSPLTDLAGYIVYVATSTHACFGRSFFSVPSPVAAPAAGDTVEFQVSGLEAGTTYAVAVSALNQAGFESDCSPEATGAARTDFTVTPSRIDFGSISVGTPVDRVFTVTNVGNKNLSLTVAGSAPFTIV